MRPSCASALPPSLLQLPLPFFLPHPIYVDPVLTQPAAGSTAVTPSAATPPPSLPPSASLARASEITSSGCQELILHAEQAPDSASSTNHCNKDPSYAVLHTLPILTQCHFYSSHYFLSFPLITLICFSALVAAFGSLPPPWALFAFCLLGSICLSRSHTASMLYEHRTQKRPKD